MDPGDVDRLRELETAMWVIDTRGDPDWMDRHLAPEFTEFGRSGRSYTRDEIITIEITSIDVELPLREFSVRAVGDDHALVTYRTVEGRGRSNRSSLWCRFPDGWRLEFHHGSPTS